MALRLLYSSLGDGLRYKVERAVRAALDDRAGEWFVSSFDPPYQPLCVVVVLDGPNAFTHTWVFEDDDSTSEIRAAIVGTLGKSSELRTLIGCPSPKRRGTPPMHRERMP